VGCLRAIVRGDPGTLSFAGSLGCDSSDGADVEEFESGSLERCFESIFRQSENLKVPLSGEVDERTTAIIVTNDFGCRDRAALN